MNSGNGHTALDETIAQLLAAQPRVRDADTVPDALEGLPLEMSSRVRQEQKWFIRLPWRLFTVVAPLPGKALAVYMLAWREGHIQASSMVTLTSTALRRCGITRDEKAHALVHLEAQGLLTVSRHRGKNPQITVHALVDRFGPPSRSH